MKLVRDEETAGHLDCSWGMRGNAAAQHRFPKRVLKMPMA
jgi:hypothetical protein